MDVYAAGLTKVPAAVHYKQQERLHGLTPHNPCPTPPAAPIHTKRPACAQSGVVAHHACWNQKNTVMVPPSCRGIGDVMQHEDTCCNPHQSPCSCAAAGQHAPIRCSACMLVQYSLAARPMLNVTKHSCYELHRSQGRCGCAAAGQHKPKGCSACMLVQCCPAARRLVGSIRIFSNLRSSTNVHATVLLQASMHTFWRVCSNPPTGVTQDVMRQCCTGARPMVTSGSNPCTAAGQYHSSCSSAAAAVAGQILCLWLLAV
jgi:hypothetical protein